MKTVILAGGKGTRIKEESYLRPKPLIEIGGMPILWHVMKIYSTYGIEDFVICTGYKGSMIKEYVANNFILIDNSSDIKKNRSKSEQKFAEPWNVRVVDTGLETMTGGRLKRIKDYLDNKTFCVTYGDDLKNVNIKELINFHKKQKTLATVTAVQRKEQFGVLTLKNDKVIDVKEKPSDNNWINGGYYVLEPSVLDYIQNDLTIWEQEPLERLAREGQLSAFKFTGFYHPLDTIQDKKYMEALWNSGRAHWRAW